MDEYIKQGNIYKPTGEKCLNGAENDVTRLQSENMTLKNRCRVLSNGLLCPHCKINCELRNKETCTN